MTSSFEFELIPLSPIPFPDERSLSLTSPTHVVPNEQRLLMRGNTLIGAARTVLKSSPPWMRVGEDGTAEGGISPNMPLRCSDLLVPADAPVMQGVPLNVSRARGSLSRLCAPHAPYPFIDIGVPRTFLPSVNIQLPDGPAKSLMAALAAAFNRFFTPQWKRQREQLQQVERVATNCAYDRWLEQSRRIWFEYALDRSIGDGSGFLMRIGHWSGCEARTIHTKYKPRRVRSRRSATGCFTDRRTPKCWWIVTPANLDSVNASPTQGAPVGWAFLRVRKAHTIPRPTVDHQSRAAAASLVCQWSIYPIRS